MLQLLEKLPNELQTYVKDVDPRCVIPTLCENLVLFSCYDDIRYPLKTSDKNMIRFLDYRLSFPLVLCDEDDMTYNDFSKESVSELNVDSDWGSFNNLKDDSCRIPELARHFLCNPHKSLILEFLNKIEYDKTPFTLHEPLYDFFSEEEKESIQEVTKKNKTSY